MKCPGLHCPGCGDGGGLALVLIAAAAAAGVRRRVVGHPVVVAACSA